MKDTTYYSSFTDDQLFALIQHSDERAFTELYNRHARLLYAVLFKYLKDDDLVENSLQNVFMKLWRDRGKINLSTNIKGYLYTAMKNDALNVIKRNAMELTKAYEVAQPEFYEPILEAIEEKERMAIIKQQVELLPDSMRSIISLKCEGYSNNEIAEKLDMPLNRVTVYYSRAIRILKNYFQDKNTILSLLIVYFINRM